MVYLSSMNLRLFLLCYLTLTSALSTVIAQATSFPSPDSFLGYSLGSRFTPHHLLVDYFRAAARSSDKVQLIEYGTTYELRPLVAAIITSPENMSRIEAIRQNNLRRTGILDGGTVAEDIVFVYLSYTVHGNEAAGAESSMAVLYDLLRGGPPVDDWLEHTVVILDPCLNPDGYSRYSQWSNSVSAHPFNPRPETRDHQEPWPGGRSNHYYFDLNRDWAWQTQKESRDRIAFYLQWMPHVHADIHEMGAESPYYFAPAAQPYHPYVTEWQSAFQTDIGKNHASHFDREGWRYYTRERFDLFYPSYGDTYPTFAGAIGMTYEQGGSGYANRAVLLENGDTLTLYDRIAHHHVASMSTIEVSARHAADLVREFSNYYKKSISDPPGGINSYVIKRNNNPGRMQDLLTLLERNQIICGVVRNERMGIRGMSYVSGEPQVFTASAGDLIIPVSQPRSVLVQVLFEPEGKMSDSLTYDITAWSVPLAYGLEVYGTEEVLPYSTRYDSARVRINSGERPYAYAMMWGSVPAARTLMSALRAGVVARYAVHPFSNGGTSYPAGTVLFMRADNRKHPGFDEVIRDIADGSVMPFHLIRGGMADAGRDLGSDAYPLVRRPEVLTFSGKGVSSLHLGEMWHFFEEELNSSLHIVDVEEVMHIPMELYNVLLLPEGYYALSDEVIERISGWVQRGGRVVAMGSGIQRVAGRSGFGIVYGSEERADSMRREEAAFHPDEYSSGQRESLTEEIPGAIFRTTMDRTHPLCFGLGQTYWTLKTGASAYRWLEHGRNAIVLEDTSTYFGFAGHKALEKMRNTLLAGHERVGGGSVVYMVDNPLFRSFWNHGKVLFANALFF